MYLSFKLYANDVSLCVCEHMTKIEYWIVINRKHLHNELISISNKLFFSRQKFIVESRIRAHYVAFSTIYSWMRLPIDSQFTSHNIILLQLSALLLIIHVFIKFSFRKLFLYPSLHIFALSHLVDLIVLIVWSIIHVFYCDLTSYEQFFFICALIKILFF